MSIDAVNTSRAPIRRTWPMRSPFLLLLTLSAQASAQAQWVAQPSGTDADLRGLSVVSRGVVWASGTHGTVLHTTNGGKTWTLDTIPGASNLDLRGIAATSSTVAHAMSIADSSRIFRTVNGGRTWSLQYMSLRKGSFFDAIRFFDPKHGIVMSDPVDGHFLLVTTDDGGDTWQEVPADRLPPCLPGERAYAASGRGIATFGRHVWFVSGGATSARVFHSTDRGLTWTVSDTPIRAGIRSAGIFSIDFRDATHGVIAGGDYRQPAMRGRNVALTSDGGATWTVVDSATSPAGFRSAITFVPGTNGRRLVAVGLNGTDVSRDGGRTWATVDTAAYNSLGFASTVMGIAVGPKGSVARFADKQARNRGRI